MVVVDEIVSGCNEGSLGEISMAEHPYILESLAFSHGLRDRFNVPCATVGVGCGRLHRRHDGPTAG